MSNGMEKVVVSSGMYNFVRCPFVMAVCEMNHSCSQKLHRFVLRKGYPLLRSSWSIWSAVAAHVVSVAVIQVTVPPWLLPLHVLEHCSMWLVLDALLF